MRPLTTRATGSPFVLSRLAVLVGLACAAMALRAQTTPPPPPPAVLDTLTLKSNSQLDEKQPSEQASKLPIFVQGDRMSGRPDLETLIEGNVVLRKAGTVIQADRIEYDQPSDQAKASGNVRINRKGDVFEGPLLELKVDAFEGFVEAPRYHFLKNDGQGQADRVDFLDESHTVIHNATYTTCRRKPGPEWLPDWVLRASQISMDSDEDVGVAQGAVLSFKGVP